MPLVDFLLLPADLFLESELSALSSVAPLIPAIFAMASSAPVTAPLIAPVAAPLITSVAGSVTLLIKPLTEPATFFWQVLLF